MENNELLDDDDKFALVLFVKALHALLKVEEGIVIEHEDKKYIVHKYVSEDGEQLISYDDRTDDELVKPLENGQLVWLDLEKSPEERHLN